MANSNYLDISFSQREGVYHLPLGRVSAEKIRTYGGINPTRWNELTPYGATVRSFLKGVWEGGFSPSVRKNAVEEIFDIALRNSNWRKKNFFLQFDVPKMGDALVEAMEVINFQNLDESDREKEVKTFTSGMVEKAVVEFCILHNENTGGYATILVDDGNLSSPKRWTLRVEYDLSGENKVLANRVVIDSKGDFFELAGDVELEVEDLISLPPTLVKRLFELRTALKDAFSGVLPVEVIAENAFPLKKDVFLSGERAVYEMIVDSYSYTEEEILRWEEDCEAALERCSLMTRT